MEGEECLGVLEITTGKCELGDFEFTGLCDVGRAFEGFREFSCVEGDFSCSIESSLGSKYEDRELWSFGVALGDDIFGEDFFRLNLAEFDPTKAPREEDDAF